MVPRNKKPSKNLVTVGTHIPMAAKLSLQSLAESQNKTVYEYLQDLIMEEIKDFDEEVDALKQPPTGISLEGVVEDDDGSDLLA